jgi:hypothetical protein
MEHVDGRIANVPDDPAGLRNLQNRECLGRPGCVTQADGRNIFTPH